MAELSEGEAIQIEGNEGRRYILAKWRGVYSCTCPSWQRCSFPVEDRTCKHLKRFLNDNDDEAYIVEARKIAELRAAGKRIPLEMLRRGRPNTSNHSQVIEDPAAIEKEIDRLALSRRLWLDTEVADWKIGHPRLSLIQAMPIESDCCPENVVVLDVLHYPDLIQVFGRKIMRESSIEKVFHNASYDLQFLSNCGVESVYCTKEIATRLRGRHNSLPVKVSLKALAEHFRLTDEADKTEQKSNWSVRPLSMQQIKYAISDIVYLRGIDIGLHQLMGDSGETLVKRKRASPRKSPGRRRDVIKIESRKIEPQEPSNSVQLPENSKELPMNVHLTWYLLSKGEATVAELAKKRGGEPAVYEQLVAAIRHGKKVDIRMIMNRSKEEKLTNIWQQLPKKNRTPEGLHDASGLSLPIEAFQCVVELFRNAEFVGAGGEAKLAEPVLQSSAKVSVPPKRLGETRSLKRRAKRKTKVAIQLTDEQLMVLDLFKNQSSLKIHAFAGAGKTQTLVEAG